VKITGGGQGSVVAQTDDEIHFFHVKAFTWVASQINTNVAKCSTVFVQCIQYSCIQVFLKTDANSSTLTYKASSTQGQISWWSCTKFVGKAKKVTNVLDWPPSGLPITLAGSATAWYINKYWITVYCGNNTQGIQNIRPIFMSSQNLKLL